MKDALKLHLGSGSVSLAGWLNIDLEAQEADMRMDLRSSLPFEASSVSHVFSEHVIEHIDREDALRLLRECRRVLRPDGVVRITTPDLMWLVDNYTAAVTDGWGNLWQPETPARMINEGMRYWGHCFIYDRPELARILREAEFEDIRFVRWRESDDPALDSIESRPFNNEIIVEARIAKCVNSTAPAPVLRGNPSAALSQLLASQGEQLEVLRLRAVEAEAALGARHEQLAALQAESGERAERLLRLESVFHEQEAEIGRLRSDNRALQHTIGEFGILRVELERLKTELDNVMRESQERSERIDELARALNRYEAYIARIRASLPGRIMLRIFGPRRVG